mmetsp:Transcript_30763/g.63644  ORF Transcript_30763/g.63644 Transcript_30763/m.63644 type:complete len:191 (-) Transcript_30763:1572-2144(-)
MRFDADLWHLPLFAAPPNTARPTPRLASRPAFTQNPFALLTDDVSEPERFPVPASTSWTQADIAVAHDTWCHPGGSMFDEITQEYPDLFPRDPKYRTAARQHRCPVCTLMKGARTYRQSKRMAEKKKRKESSPPPPMQPSVTQSCATAPDDGGRRCRLHVGYALASHVDARACPRGFPAKQWSQGGQDPL